MQGVNMKKYAFRIILMLFLAWAALALSSRLCVVLRRNPDILKNEDPYGIMKEAEYTIDVVTVGDSDVYSAVSPMILWGRQGITAYNWSEAGARIYDCRYFLKNIYKKQSPKVVMISVNSIFEEESRVDSADRRIRAAAAYRFPVFAVHRFWRNIRMLPGCLKTDHSVSKGYYTRLKTVPAPARSI